MTSTAEADPAPAAKPSRPSPWAPFSHKAFLVLWITTVISNIGTWMHEVGAGWLMTELAPSPAIVSLVQAATTLPVFLFALLAGAIADIVDRRVLLLVINVILGIAAGIMAMLVAAGMMTPVLLLLFTFLFGTGAAFMAPAWQAVVPSLVPRPELPAAVSLNSMGINVSRAIGPALAGALIVSVGLSAPFILNALSVVGIILALLWWKPEIRKKSGLPAEHVFGAMAAGVRYAMNSKPLKMTLVRAAAFFLFASAYWAMLPLIAREVLQGGATLYGILLGCVGGGAVAGALIMPKIRSVFGTNGTVAAGSILTAVVLLVLALIPSLITACIAAAMGGIAWISVLSTLNVSAQTSLPDWGRARGLSIFLTVFFGAMALGSLVWGQVATYTSIETALIVAAVGALTGIPLTWFAKLGLGEQMDLTPSSHWPTPVVADDGMVGDGPVRIEITYTVTEDKADAFLEALENLAEARRRLGAHSWQILRDAESPTLWVETWSEASWEAHLRHHERVSVEDQALQDAVKAVLGGAEPRVRHLVGVG